MKRIPKSLIAVLLGGAILLLLFIFALFSLSSEETKDYSRQDLINNYQAKAGQIHNVCRFIDSAFPQGSQVHVEFSSNDQIAIFQYAQRDFIESNFRLDINSAKVDTILTSLGWSKNTLTELKRRLDNANCISVESGQPCKVGYQRRGFGMYFYDLFSRPIPTSNRPAYNDSCRYILYNDTVVLEYGGGVFGPQCFPERTK
jgi:hypothetical protein